MKTETNVSFVFSQTAPVRTWDCRNPKVAHFARLKLELCLNVDHVVLFISSPNLLQTKGSFSLSLYYLFRFHQRKLTSQSNSVWRFCSVSSQHIYWYQYSTLTAYWIFPPCLFMCEELNSHLIFEVLHKWKKLSQNQE